MGKPRQRAVDILGLQHQSGRCGSRASGRTSKQTIANGGRPTASEESFRGEFESWWQRRVAPSPCSAEPAFSAAASFGICAIANFPFGSRQGIRIGGTASLALTIPQLQFLEANIQDERLVVDALAGAYGVVNAVSLYIEHGLETSHSVHVESAQRVAAQAHRAGVERLVHVSGIGADAASQSRYIRKRGEGELAVRAAFLDALFVRPAVMFGPNDAFLTTILKLLRQLPIYPMFGRGRTRLRQVYVEDVAEALLESCGEPRRIRQSSSSAARASIRDVPLLPRKVITSAPDGTASPASR